MSNIAAGIIAGLCIVALGAFLVWAFGSFIMLTWWIWPEFVLRILIVIGIVIGIILGAIVE